MAQTAAVKDGMFHIATLVPALGFGLLAVVLIFWYPPAQKSGGQEYCHSEGKAPAVILFPKKQEPRFSRLLLLYFLE